MVAHQDERPLPFPPGSSVRHYRIVEEIGRGGMGVVYRALDQHLGRVVAMKCPWPEQELNESGARRMDRFHREIKIQSGFNQPNIIRLIDAFEEEGTPWLVMEYVEGTSLADEIVRRGHLGTKSVLRYARHLTSALEHAHARNILHRDIKPSNVLISRDDVAYLMDFGLARFIRPEEKPGETTSTAFQTSVHVQLGTTSYMSPEQVKAGDLDERSDVFCLGAVLYEMCTGFAPFPGDSRADIEHRIKYDPPTPMARFSYDIPEGLERIILRCLSKDPSIRYQTMRDLGAALRREERRQDFSEITRDNPELVEELVGIRIKRLDWRLYALAGLAVGMAGFALYKALGEPPPPPVPIQITSGDDVEQGPRLSPDGGRIAYAATIEGNLDVYVSDVRGGKPLRITTDPAPDWDVCWSPDGSALYFTSERGGNRGIWKTGAFGGTPTLVRRVGSYPAISPDGKWIAFSTPGPEGDLVVAKALLADPDRETILSEPGEGLWDHEHPSWSPDGRTIAFSAFSDVWMVSAAGGGTRRLTHSGTLHEYPAWSPDGKHIYFTSFLEGTAAVWRVNRSGGKLRRITFGTGPENHPDISRDGSRLVYATNVDSHDLFLFSPATATETRIPGVGDEWMPALLPDGLGVVYASDRYGGRFSLWFQEMEGGFPKGTPRRLTDQQGFASHPVVSPDGKWVAYYLVEEDRRNLWVLGLHGEAPHRITEGAFADTHPAWSPDGQRLAFCSDREGGNEIWVLGMEAGAPTGPPQRVSDTEATLLAPIWDPVNAEILCIARNDNSGEVLVRLDPLHPSELVVVIDDRPIVRARFARASGDLWVSAWDDNVIRLTRHSGSGEAEDVAVCGSSNVSGVFDVTPDARVVVFSREERRGDVWLLESTPGTF